MESDPSRVLKSFGFRLVTTLGTLGVLLALGWFCRILMTQDLDGKGVPTKTG